MNKKTAITTIIGALCAASLLSACGSAANGTSASTSSSTSKVSGTITVYTSEPQDKLNEIIKDFNAVYPDITVKN